MAESHSRTTVKSRLSRPLNGVIHQTQRRVSSEYPLPLLGDTMAAELGASYADSIVIAASLTPDLGKEMGTITHAQIPTEVAQLASNWEHSTCDIGGVKFDSVQRTVIMLASAYSASAPAIGSALVANPNSAPILGEGYVLADRQQVLSGSELEPVFRVERRNHVKRVTLGEVEVDPQTGIASRAETTLYYHGETVLTGKTIEQLIADPAHAYWSTREDGFGRSGQQLSEKWYSVTDRKIVDLESQWEKESNRLRPDKFYCPKDVHKTTTTTANNSAGPPTTPEAPLGSSISIVKIGRIERTTTTTQSGSAQVLKSLELMPGDGYIYPSTEELVSSAAVPVTRSYINSSGQAITFNNVDACNAIKQTRQAVSLEDAWIKTAERFIPERFIKDASTRTTEETETGTTTEPAAPTAEDRKKITIQQKGVIRKTETTEQAGTVTTLKGTSSSDDGYAYPVTQKVVALSAVPIIRTRILGDGTIKEHSPVDANWAVEETRQAVSLEPEYRKQSSKAAPDQFFSSNQKSITETTQAGVVTEPATPAVAPFSEVSVVQKGAIRKTTTVTQPGNPVPLYGTTVDRRTGETFIETSQLVPASAVVPSEINSDGTIPIFEPIDANWARKITRKAVSTLTKTWTTDIDYEWPTVLLGISFKVWNRKDGAGSAVYPVPRYKKGFSEPQTAVVSQYWQKAVPVIVPRPTMVAEGFTYRCPLYSISVPPCLHKTITLSCSIGTSDPDWESATDSEVFTATQFTDWPPDIFWRLAEPHLGGYLVTEYRLPRPA